MSTPDLSTRPRRFTMSRDMPLEPRAVYDAFTSQQFEDWFAAPGTLHMCPRVDMPFYFETEFEGARHPHYGRFLQLERGRVIEMTWATAAGTLGVETVVTIELEPAAGGTRLTFTQAGFPNDETRQRHADAWPHVLDLLEQYVIRSRGAAR